MNFQVPQFIDIEDKIFGPLTLKQFLYIAGSAGLAFIVYVILPLWLAIIPIGAIIAFGLALTFYQVNNQPFIEFVQSVLTYSINSKMYIWKKSSPEKKKKIEAKPETETKVPKLSASRLKDLSWSLDVKEKID
jgi:hypothetical protein